MQNYQNHYIKTHLPRHRETNQFPHIRRPYNAKDQGPEIRNKRIFKTLSQYPLKRTTWQPQKRLNVQPTDTIRRSPTKGDSSEAQRANERKEFARKVADYLIIQREIQVQLTLHAKNTINLP